MIFASKAAALALSFVMLLESAGVAAQAAPAAAPPSTQAPAATPSASSPAQVSSPAPAGGLAPLTPIPPQGVAPDGVPYAPQASAAESAVSAVEPASQSPHLAETVRQLIALEERAKQIESERAKVRVLGLRIGKYISWAAFGLFTLNALSFWGRAEQVQEAREDGRTDKAYDVNGDGDVTGKDESIARGFGRGFIIAALVPLGLGIFTTVLQRKRQRQIHGYDLELRDVSSARRRLLSSIAPEVGVSASQASLTLRMRF